MEYMQGERVRIITDNPKYGWGFARKGDIGFIQLQCDGEPVRILLDEHRDKALWLCTTGEIEPFPYKR